MHLVSGQASGSSSTAAYSSCHTSEALKMFIRRFGFSEEKLSFLERTEIRRTGIIDKNREQTISILRTCKSWDSAPAAVPVLGYMVEEFLILLRRPEPLPQLLLVAAGMPPH
jgi:hypothetical protein